MKRVWKVILEDTLVLPLISTSGYSCASMACDTAMLNAIQLACTLGNAHAEWLFKVLEQRSPRYTQLSESNAIRSSIGLTKLCMAGHLGSVARRAEG